MESPQDEQLSLSEAISIAEGYTVYEERLGQAEKVFHDGLRGIPEDDNEKKGQYYYYLLRIMLRKHIHFENPMLLNFYQNMSESFQKKANQYQEEYRTEEDVRKKSLVKTQMKAFYKMLERYYQSLEIVYDKKGFVEATDRAYEQKMMYRMERYKQEGKWDKHFSYRFFQISSNFGLSFVRWGGTALFIVLIFALLFLLTDSFSAVKAIAHADVMGFEYIYFSVVTFAGLGYGDIVPATLLQQLIVSVEAFIGYIMLAMFIHLMLKRL